MALSLHWLRRVSPPRGAFGNLNRNGMAGTGRVPLMAAPHGVLTGRRLNRDLPGGPFYPEVPSGVEDSKAEGYATSLSYDTDFLEPCAILIGNEGAGLTPEARRLADEEVLIPCGVESLNAAVAGSVLMYEVMRQRVLRAWARKQGLRP